MFFHNLITKSLILAIWTFAITGSANVRSAQADDPTINEMKAEFTRAPCNNKDRQSAVKAMFTRLGAAESDISVEKYGSVENVVLHLKGATDEQVVIGAHYDKVSAGCGAVDNWTGIVAIAYLYRALKADKTEKSYTFVAFGKEEEGLIGSHAMARAIREEALGGYCAMVNIDSLGLTSPRLADNLGSRKLLDLAAELGKKMGLTIDHRRLEAADADSSSFIERKIPAITIDGLTNNWDQILHSSNDQATKVNPVAVYLGYRLAFAVISRIDSSTCNAFR